MLGPDIDLSSVRRNRLNLFGDRKKATAINYRPQTEKWRNSFFIFMTLRQAHFDDGEVDGIELQRHQRNCGWVAKWERDGQVMLEEVYFACKFRFFLFVCFSFKFVMYAYKPLLSLFAAFIRAYSTFRLHLFRGYILTYRYLYRSREMYITEFYAD